jgi:hypothetical protein
LKVVDEIKFASQQKLRRFLDYLDELNVIREYLNVVEGRRVNHGVMQSEKGSTLYCWLKGGKIQEPYGSLWKLNRVRKQILPQHFQKEHNSPANLLISAH